MSINRDSQKVRAMNRLKEVMDEYSINIRELSTKSGVSDASISQYCRGLYIPGMDKAIALGNALNVNPNWLRGEKEAKKDDEAIDEEIVSAFKKLTVKQRETIKYIIDKFIDSNELKMKKEATKNDGGFEV